jgi:AraC-like DNA-binding protein
MAMSRSHKPSDPTVRRLLRARDRMRDDYAGELSLEVLAKTSGLSPFHFQRTFHAVFGRTPHAYLAEVRLDRAKERLARGVSVTETCFDVGFASPGTFSTWFARRNGVSPREWQRRVRKLVVVPELVRGLWVPSCFIATYTG